MGRYVAQRLALSIPTLVGLTMVVFFIVREPWVLGWNGGSPLGRGIARLNKAGRDTGGQFTCPFCAGRHDSARRKCN